VVPLRRDEVEKVMHERLLRIQRWNEPYRGEEETWIPQNEAELVGYLRSLTDGQTTTVIIEMTEERWLGIDVDQGRFSVVAVGEDGVFDLIGDVTANETVAFAVGGQRVDFPQGYLVSFDQVVAAAITFFRTGTVNVTAGWLQQGPNDLWSRAGIT
jgi:hypothetical protein